VRTPSRLAGLLHAGRFVVTAELSSVDSGEPEAVWRRVEPLRGVVDAVNCTDNTGAHVHMSSLAAAHLLVEKGIEPIMQLAARDRNRLALQADLLGAAALGVRNILLMSGDDVTAGDHPEARSIYDIDSLQLVQVARNLRDRGTYLSGRRLESPPVFFVGAVENPFAPPLDFRPFRLQKKVEAGAEFIQTQLVFDLTRFHAFMARVEDLGLLERVFVIASIGIPRSARGTHFMKEKVPGLSVPDDVIRRMESVPPLQQPAEGIRIAIELVEAVRSIRGISGVHLIGIKWEEGVVRVAQGAGLLPRPVAEVVATVGGGA